MEPMAMGSPSSPTSPGGAPNFLPSYLIGESQPSRSVSPGRNKTPSVKLGYNTPTQDPRNLRQKLFRQSKSDSFGLMSPESSYNMQPERIGPPKQGLFDSMDSTTKLTPPVLSSTVQYPAEQPTFTSNESFSIIDRESLSLNHSIASPQLLPYKSPMQNSRRCTGDSQWVTVFGFPPSAASLVLAQLANCGCIAEKKFPTQGNWINIKYSSPLEANKALSLNGKMIANNIMIGVVPYVNKTENKENCEYIEPRTPVRARSLQQSFVSPQIISPVLPQNVPQKSTGLVSKAMEYVFGW